VFRLGDGSHHHRDKGAKAVDGEVADRKRWVVGDKIVDAAGDAFGVGTGKTGGVRVDKNFHVRGMVDEARARMFGGVAQ
jgi:hypothetical protein